MTVRVIVACDGPGETGQCRAFLPTRTIHWAEALVEARNHGWSTAPDGTDRCPGHRVASESRP